MASIQDEKRYKAMMARVDELFFLQQLRILRKMTSGW